MNNRKPLKFMIAGIFFLLFVCADASYSQTRKAVGTAEINGTFRDYFDAASKRNFNEIKILSTGKNKLKVSFSLLYPDPAAGADGAGNTGSAEGEAVISGNTAIFSPRDFQQCRITLKFVKPGQIKVTQKGNDTDCGFGANVSATGTYKRVSAVKPNFKSTR